MSALLLFLGNRAASDPVMDTLRVADLLRLARVSKEARRCVAYYNQDAWVAALRPLALPPGDVVVRRVEMGGEEGGVPRFRELLDGSSSAERRCHECLRVQKSLSKDTNDDMFHVYFAIRKRGELVRRQERPKSLGMLCRGCTREEGGFRRVLGSTKAKLVDKDARRLTLVYLPRASQKREKLTRKNRLMCAWYER
tara:strand:- start:22 stop:609 length:588 start_codon:yes stop_codon:yes gene_type:complete